MTGTNGRAAFDPDGERQRLSRRAVVTGSTVGLVGLASVGVAASGVLSRSEPDGGAGGASVDLRRYGAVADGRTDLAAAINRAVADCAGTACTLSLPVIGPGESYLLDTDAALDQPGISLNGGGAVVRVADGAALHVGHPDRRIVMDARISGVRWLRDGTDLGRRIPASSRFLVLHRVRNLVIASSTFRGADIAIHVPPNPASGQHDTAFIRISGENTFEEVNYAVKGEYDPTSPGGWLALAEVFITGVVVNRAYITGVHLDGVDGLELVGCDFVNVGSRSLDEPRVGDKRHNVYVGRCDWVHITDNQLYEAGDAAVRIDAGRQVKITGNLIAWPGQLTPADGITVTGYPEFSTRAVITDNAVVSYSRSAVTVAGRFASLVVGPNAVGYDPTGDRYVGPQVRGADAPTLDSVEHFRYDLGQVRGLTAAELTVVGSASSRTGETDRLPGHEATRRAERATSMAGSSAAERVLGVTGSTAVFPLAGIDGSAGAFAGTVLVLVRPEPADDGGSAQYLLMVDRTGQQCSVLGQTGATTARGPRAPAFRFSVVDASLVVTPQTDAVGTFAFSAQATGNLLVG